MNNIVSSTVGLIIANLLSKVLGFIREIVLASAYGTSMYSDAYITAFNIPFTIFSIVGTAISTTFIPLYYDVKNNDGDIECKKFTNNVLNITIIICFILAMIGYIFAEPLVKIFAVGFEGDVLNVTVQFTKILIFGIVFIGMTNLLTGYLNANNNFILPGLIGIPYNIIIIIAIILSSILNIEILIWGTLLAFLAQSIFQIISLYKFDFKYRIYIDLKSKYLKKALFLIAPVIIGVAVTQLNTMIDRSLASTLTEGSISALNYANRLNTFILALFISSIGSVVYPMLSKLSSKDDKQEFNQSIVRIINIVILLILPITIGAISLSTPIVKILFQRGAFDEAATQMTSSALMFYSIGLIGISLREILGKVFYSLKDTKTPMINGVISVVLNIVLNLTLIKFMGHVGLALATSISSLICIVLLYRSLKKKIGDFGQDEIFKVLYKSLIASISMGIVVINIYNLLNSLLGQDFILECISLAVSIVIGAISYAILVMLLKVEEVKFMTDIIKQIKVINKKVEI